jgi:O-antigen/teichoic acid export membrane protein
MSPADDPRASPETTSLTQTPLADPVVAPVDAVEPVARSTGQRGRAVWSLLAQALGSLFSLVTTIAAARALTEVDFGYFAALVFVAILFAGLVAALLSQPLLLTSGGPERIAVQARSMLVAAPAFGAIAGVLLVASSPFFGRVQDGLWVVGLSFPLAAVCDVFRYFGSVIGRPALAVVVEVLRLLLFFGGYALVQGGGTSDATSMVALWCLASAAAGVVALLLGGWMTREASGDLRQFLTPRFLGYQFGLEYLLGVVARGIPILSLGWFVSVVAIGHYRGMLTLFGPILVLATSVVVVLTPFLVANPGRRRSVALVVMGALFVVASLAWMLVLLVLPTEVGEQILGDAWSGSRELTVPVALQMAGTGILTTAQTGVRVERPRASFVLSFAAITFFLACFVVGVLLGDLQGAAWGFAVGALGSGAIAVGIYLWVRVGAAAPRAGLA